IILCLSALSALIGTITLKIIDTLEYSKNTEKNIVIIDESDAPYAIAYYDILYFYPDKSDIEEKKDVALYNLEHAEHTEIPDGKSALVPINLSYNDIGLINETGYKPDLDLLLLSELSVASQNVLNDNIDNKDNKDNIDNIHNIDNIDNIDDKINKIDNSDINYRYAGSAKTKEQPLVLILHTHGTESYAAEGEFFYNSDYGFRSDDIAENVISVGAAMSDTFAANGIPAVHCAVMHDKESYLNSYKRASETINFYLDKYPSIILVLDVHRDALVNSADEILKPVTTVEINGETVTAAQIMCVVGTDYRGAIHPQWRDNLALALKLRYSLDSLYTNLSRPINLRGAAFNQQYAPLSLLLEIGSTGNTLAEALRSGELVAKALSEILMQIL
ncbi:MAG: stage II sporulation protein P, partial [Eubacteriales bacterium]|nr:stage II sporulation protein P [Eubacteriales bacterium]